MKLLMILALLALPMAALADDGPLEGGQYAECVRWTTMNGMETSKNFQFVYGADGSALLTIAYFENTATCQGSASWMQSCEIAISQSSGGNVVKILNGQDQKSKMYFKIVLTPTYVSIYSSETLPVNPDPMHTIYLRRAN